MRIRLPRLSLLQTFGAVSLAGHHGHGRHSRDAPAQPHRAPRPPGHPTPGRHDRPRGHRRPATRRRARQRPALARADRRARRLVRVERPAARQALRPPRAHRLVRRPQVHRAGRVASWRRPRGARGRGRRARRGRRRRARRQGPVLRGLRPDPRRRLRELHVLRADRPRHRVGHPLPAHRAHRWPAAPVGRSVSHRRAGLAPPAPPGHARHAHRAVQPRGAPRARRQGAGERRPRRLPRGPHAHRPRPLQGGQRHARPRAAATACSSTSPSACASCCAATTSWPASAATSSPSCSPTCPPRRRRSRWPARLHRALAPPLRRRRRRHSTLGASIGHRAAARPRRGRRRRSCATPTSPCTRPSARDRTSRPTRPSAIRTRAERLKLLGELRHALDHDELVLHFQPKVALEQRQRDRRRGAGALGASRAWAAAPARVPRSRGAHGPHRRRSRAGSSTPRCASAPRGGARGSSSRWRSISPPRTSSTTTLPESVAHILQRWEVPGRLLECEISEDTVMGDPRRAGDVLERLRALGVRLSLDDFGTGHSSLVLPQASAPGRGQDRPLLRHRHGRRPLRRGDRAFHHRPRTPSRARGRRRRRRDDRGPRRARRARNATSRRASCSAARCRRRSSTAGWPRALERQRDREEPG